MIKYKIIRTKVLRGYDYNSERTGECSDTSIIKWRINDWCSRNQNNDRVTLTVFNDTITVELKPNYKFIVSCKNLKKSRTIQGKKKALEYISTLIDELNPEEEKNMEVFKTKPTSRLHLYGAQMIFNEAWVDETNCPADEEFFIAGGLYNSTSDANGCALEYNGGELSHLIVINNSVYACFFDENEEETIYECTANEGLYKVNFKYEITE